MASMKFLLFYIIASTLMWKCQSSSGTGPYEVIYERVYPCEDQGTNEANVSIRMYRTQERHIRRFVHSGAFTWPEGANDADLHLVVYKKSADWVLFLEETKKFCECAFIAKSYFESFCNATTNDATGETMKPVCPASPGRYTIQDWDMQGQVEMPVFPYGYYKSVGELLKDGKKFGCVEGLYEIKEKFESVDSAPIVG